MILQNPLARTLSMSDLIITFTSSWNLVFTFQPKTFSALAGLPISISTSVGR